METMAKEKGDMFDTMVVDEAKIRLGEEGWKERYYQVGSRLLCCKLYSMGSSPLYSPRLLMLQCVMHLPEYFDRSQLPWAD